MTVAALFVETDGAYFGLSGVDPWDERRDESTTQMEQEAA